MLSLWCTCFCFEHYAQNMFWERQHRVVNEGVKVKNMESRQFHAKIARWKFDTAIVQPRVAHVFF